VGGACGEIRAMLGTACCQLLNPLVAAQNFEYKMSNILDKPLESVFGYISVLPGAFSAYRYAALKNDINGHGPLEKYFIGEDLHGNSTKIGPDGKEIVSNKTGLFKANMYLAEDRILCFELVAKKDERWLLQYVASAFGETDVPNQLPEFISQRRRWLNGSFFAGVYGLIHFRKIWNSGHGFSRTLLLMIEGVYNVISLIFSWFSVVSVK
jgi:chitin synthase